MILAFRAAPNAVLAAPGRVRPHPDIYAERANGGPTGAPAHEFFPWSNPPENPPGAGIVAAHGERGPARATRRRRRWVHDMDGDDQPEYAVSSATAYAVYEADASILWQAVVSDLSGLAGGTAFDFLGSGIAQAMYGDENNLLFDGSGMTLFQSPRGSLTLIEYPVVADVDDDGSAEIVVTSNSANSPAVQVVRDIEDRWIQARRIWN